MGHFSALPPGYGLCPGCQESAVRRGGKPLCPACLARGLTADTVAHDEVSRRGSSPPAGKIVEGGRKRDELLEALGVTTSRLPSQQRRKRTTAQQQASAEPGRADAAPSLASSANSSEDDGGAAREGAGREPRRVSFTVPGDPTVKQRPRSATSVTADPTAPNGVRVSQRWYTPSDTSAYEAMVGFAAAAAVKGKPLQGYLRITVKVFSTKMVADTDNWLKAIKDGAQQCAYADDRQVRSDHIDQITVFDGEPRVEVVLEAYDPTTGQVLSPAA